MTGVENVNLSARYVFAVAFRLARIEREVIFTPDHQQARLLLAHPRLPFWIGVHIGSIVVEQITLNVGLTRLVEKIKLIGPEIGVGAFHLRIVSHMARARGPERQELCAHSIPIRSPIRPTTPPRLPIRPYTFL